MNTLPRNVRTPTLTSQEGFALPAAIFALVVVAFLVTSGIHMANQESRIGASTERSTQAFYVTETGLNTVLANWAPGAANLEIWEAPRTILGDTVETATFRGEWTVRATRVDSLMYFVQSTGRVGADGGPQARRALGQMGRLTTLSFEPSGALTLRGGVHAQGAPKKVDGSDEHPNGFCKGGTSDLPGIVTDDESQVTASPWPPGADCPNQYQGDPCIEEDPDAVESQWAGMNAQWDGFTALASHHITNVDQRPFPTLDWDDDDNYWCETSNLWNWGDPLLQRPDPTFDPTVGDPEDQYPCFHHAPLIHAEGDIVLTDDSRGQGILMVEGSLTMSGNAEFHGIILVRGTFNVASGNPTIRGSVLAEEVGTFGGTPNILYSSCAVENALSKSTATRLRTLDERSWVDLTGISF